MLTTEVAALPLHDLARFFSTLADETRLSIVRLLALTDMRAGELVQRLQLPQNAVSYHLKQLRELGLLQDRRSSADGRDVYYSLHWERLEALYSAVGQTFHPGYSLRLVANPPQAGTAPLRVLFLCTHNSARSQLAEGLMRQLGGDGVEVFSAGTAPASAVHPDVALMLAELGAASEQQVPKSVELFADQRFDYVVTVCDRARESCPNFPNDPTGIHWSFPDPLEVGNDAARRQMLQQLQRELLTRLRLLLSVPRRQGAGSENSGDEVKTL